MLLSTAFALMSISISHDGRSVGVMSPVEPGTRAVPSQRKWRLAEGAVTYGANASCGNCEPIRIAPLVLRSKLTPDAVRTKSSSRRDASQCARRFREFERKAMMLRMSAMRPSRRFALRIWSYSKTWSYALISSSLPSSWLSPTTPSPSRSGTRVMTARAAPFTSRSSLIEWIMEFASLPAKLRTKNEVSRASRQTSRAHTVDWWSVSLPKLVNAMVASLEVRKRSVRCFRPFSQGPSSQELTCPVHVRRFRVRSREGGETSLYSHLTAP